MTACAAPAAPRTPAEKAPTAAPAASVTQAPVKLKVAVFPFLSSAVFKIAKDEGYFAEQGLDVELVPLKSSNEAIPLAPEHGTNHHIRFVTESRPGVLVTTAAQLSHADAVLAGTAQIPVILTDDPPAGASTGPRVDDISPAAFAALFYTSGTTGQPRGVVHSHGQITALAAYGREDEGLTAASRVAHLSSYAFAGSERVLYSTLLSSATLCAYSLQAGAFGDLYQFLLRERVTSLTAGPSVLRGLAAAAEGQPPLVSLRTVGPGAETVTPEAVMAAMRLLTPGCRVICRLASTETSVYACYHIEVGAPLSWEGERVPAGYAPPHVEVMIVNADRRPLPPGAEGEIAVRSPFLAPGYWNLPELNATRFLPDPDGRGPPYLPDRGPGADGGGRAAGVPGTDGLHGEGAGAPGGAGDD